MKDTRLLPNKGYKSVSSNNDDDDDALPVVVRLAEYNFKSRADSGRDRRRYSAKRGYRLSQGGMLSGEGRSLNLLNPGLNSPTSSGP